MNRNDIEELLRAEKENFIADISNKIEEIKRMDIKRVPVPVQGKRQGAGRLWRKVIATLCAVLLIFVPAYILLSQPEVATVHALYIDVNPSIKLMIDGAEKVIDAKLINDDAEALFDIRGLKSKKLEEALDIIIEKLSERGYFESEDTEIILSMVDDEEDALLTRYQQKVSAILTKRVVTCSVVLNKMTRQEQKEIEEEDRNAAVTPGQLKYIKEIIKKEPETDVNAIKDNLKDKNTTLLRMINTILEKDSNQKLSDLIKLNESEIVQRYNNVKKNSGGSNDANQYRPSEKGSGNDTGNHNNVK